MAYLDDRRRHSVASSSIINGRHPSGGCLSLTSSASNDEYMANYEGSGREGNRRVSCSDHLHSMNRRLSGSDGVHRDGGNRGCGHHVCDSDDQRLDDDDNNRTKIIYVKYGCLEEAVEFSKSMNYDDFCEIIFQLFRANLPDTFGKYSNELNPKLWRVFFKDSKNIYILKNGLKNNSKYSVSFLHIPTYTFCDGKIRSNEITGSITGTGGTVGSVTATTRTSTIPSTTVTGGTITTSQHQTNAPIHNIEHLNIPAELSHEALTELSEKAQDLFGQLYNQQTPISNKQRFTENTNLKQSSNFTHHHNQHRTGPHQQQHLIDPHHHQQPLIDPHHHHQQRQQLTRVERYQECGALIAVEENILFPRKATLRPRQKSLVDTKNEEDTDTDEDDNLPIKFPSKSKIKTKVKVIKPSMTTVETIEEKQIETAAIEILHQENVKPQRQFKSRTREIGSPLQPIYPSLPKRRTSISSPTSPQQTQTHNKLTISTLLPTSPVDLSTMPVPVNLPTMPGPPDLPTMPGPLDLVPTISDSDYVPTIPSYMILPTTTGTMDAHTTTGTNDLSSSTMDLSRTIDSTWTETIRQGVSVLHRIDDEGNLVVNSDYYKDVPKKVAEPLNITSKKAVYFNWHSDSESPLVEAPRKKKRPKEEIDS